MPISSLICILTKQFNFLVFQLHFYRLSVAILPLCIRYSVHKAPHSRQTGWAIGYDTPDNYYRRFMEGEIEHREIFGKRILSEIPKGRRKARKSTLGNESHSIQSVESTLENV